MPFYVNVPFGSFEIDDDQLTFIVEHEVLRFYISIAVSTVMNEFEYFKNVNQNRFGRKPDNVAFVSFQNYVAGVLSFVVKQPVDAGPLSHGDVFPQPVVDLDDWIETFRSIFHNNRMWISLRISVEDGSVLGAF